MSVRDRPWTPGPPGIHYLHVHVQPRAKRAGIAGIHPLPDGPALKVSLKSPPLDGRANDELTELVAEALGLRRQAVTLESGEKSRDKRLRIEGTGPAELDRLAEP